MNNNNLKQQLLSFISDKNINLISYQELQIANLSCSPVEIKIKSNLKAIHTIVVDYHLNIKDIGFDINGSNVTTHTFDQVHEIINFCNNNGV